MSDTSITRVTGRVYPRDGYSSVTPLLIPGSRGLAALPVICLYGSTRGPPRTPLKKKMIVHQVHLTRCKTGERDILHGKTQYRVKTRPYRLGHSACHELVSPRAWPGTPFRKTLCLQRGYCCSTQNELKCLFSTAGTLANTSKACKATKNV